MSKTDYIKQLDEIFKIEEIEELDEGFADFLPNPVEWIESGMREVLGGTIMGGIEVLKSEGVNWFIIKTLWWILRHYGLELSILAGITTLITWTTFKVKRWWDGSSGIINKLEEQQKESEKRLKSIEDKIDQQIQMSKLDQEQRKKIQKTLIKMMSDMK